MTMTPKAQAMKGEKKMYWTPYENLKTSVKETGTLHTVGGNVNWCSHCNKEFLKKITSRSTI